MSEHTREPWEHVETRVYLGNEGGFDLRGSPAPEANARRIVACVNALQGVPTEWLEKAVEIGVTDITTGNVFSSRLTLQQQRDKLLLIVRGLMQKTPGAWQAAETIIAEIEAAQ